LLAPIEVDHLPYIPRRRQELAKFVEESMSRLGAPLAPGSRLWQMHRLITESTEMLMREDPRFDIGLEAERDLQQVAYILDQQHAADGHPGLVERLKVLSLDSALPQLDRQQSKGRNVQFELYVAALCQDAGMLPVDYEEPDITCEMDGTMLGIAAKRIKSEPQIRKRIKEGIEQVTKSKMPGIVAVDTTLSLNPQNLRMFVVLPDEVVMPWYKERMTNFLREYDSKIRKWTKGTPVLGLLVYDSHVRQEPNGEYSWTGMTMRFETARDTNGA
jgi:hypothetical protein